MNTALQHGDTRMQAYAQIEKELPRLQQMVLYALRVYRAHGLTAQETEGVTGLQQSTVSARLTELHSAGLIYDKGDRRKTRSGRNAVIWRVTE
jgi:predicted transcriptional regulator